MIPAASPVDVTLAFGAGILTIAAPCILPMLPFLLGVSFHEGGRLRPLFVIAGFVSSFSVFAYLFGTFASALGLAQETLRNGAIFMLGVFGILMLWPHCLQALSEKLNGLLNRANDIGNRAGPGNIGGLLLGVSMGIVWTPCAGPALGSILALVAAAQDPGRSLLLLACFALGASVPMLVIAYGGQYVAARVRVVSRHAMYVQKGFGVLIVLAAAAMFFQYDTLITVWLTSLV